LARWPVSNVISLRPTVAETADRVERVMLMSASYVVRGGGGGLKQCPAEGAPSNFHRRLAGPASGAAPGP
jgi:hypothetical protein